MKIEEKVFSQCLNARKNEKILIITDAILRDIAIPFFNVGCRISRDTTLMEMIPRALHGEEPPEQVRSAMETSTIILMITSKSLTHTHARKAANAKGAKIVSMPGVTKEMISRCFDINYWEMKRKMEKVKKKIERARFATLKSGFGGELRLELEGREWMMDCGILETGEVTNLPAGELFIAPVEGKACGEVFIDGSIAGIAPLGAPPLHLVFEGGILTKIEGKDAPQLTSLLEKKGGAARNLAELGIGFNPKATISGNTLEDEKVAGTCHIAIGDNSTIGGEIRAGIHIDCVIKSPTLSIDGNLIIREGTLMEA
jgi:leucyl aminopeptidase (aminopeptidase T)